MKMYKCYDKGLSSKSVIIKPHTIRGEIFKRLMAHRRAIKKGYSSLKMKPESYMATLGLGKTSKERDETFTGWSIDDMQYKNGIAVR